MSKFKKLFSRMMAFVMILNCIGFVGVQPVLSAPIGTSIDITNYNSELEASLILDGWNIDSNNGTVTPAWVNSGDGYLKLGESSSDGIVHKLYNHAIFKDQIVEVTFAKGSNWSSGTTQYMNVYGKISDDNNYYAARFTRGTAGSEYYDISIIKSVAGVETSLAKGTTTVKQQASTVTAWKFSLDGENIALYQDGKVFLSCTDTSPLKSGGYGIKVSTNKNFQLHKLAVELLTTPPTPITPIVTPGNGQVELNWSKVEDAEKYTIYRGTSSTSLSELHVITDTNTTNYTDTELTNKTTYYYAVTAINDIGLESEKRVISAIPADPNVPPDAPTNLKAISGNEKVTLRWDASAGAVTYNIYYYEGVNSSSPTEIMGITGTPYLVAGLTNGEVYTFYVKAVNANGIESDTSDTVTATPEETEVTIKSGVWFETAYATWGAVEGASGYSAYYKLSSADDSDYRQVDKELVRGRRVDVLGLKGDTEYTIKIVPIIGDDEDEDSALECEVTPESHDRSGFAFSPNSKYKAAVGGYLEDGTVNPQADIIYVTAENMNTGPFVVGSTTYGSLGALFPAGASAVVGTGSKGSGRPLIIRFIGTIATNTNDLSSWPANRKRSDKTKDIPTGLNGDVMLSLKDTGNITLEGVGSDAMIYGWGIELVKCYNIVVRNLTFDYFYEDGISMKGNSESTGATANSSATTQNIWINHNEVRYGQDRGGDKAKGDGATDNKDTTTYYTISYNHYINSGKSLLSGATKSEKPFFGTYAYNWFDGSGSRHPRVRSGSVHVYNNLYDGVYTYGIGAAYYSSIRVENNYFQNTKRPMMISGQGTDVEDGATGTFSSEFPGAIKESGSYMDDFSKKTFKDGKDNVPVSLPDNKFAWGSIHYYNADLDTAIAAYPKNVVTAEQAFDIVQEWSGPMQFIDYSVAPPAPQNVTAEINEDETFTLRWERVASARTYKIEWDQGTGTYTTLSSNIDSSTYTTTQMAENSKTYNFKVYSVNETDETPSDVVSISYLTPNTPTGLTITQLPGGFGMEWNASSPNKASSYEVKVDYNGETIMEDTMTETSATLEGLSTGDYGISVTAKNGKLSSGDLTDTASVVAMIETKDLIVPIVQDDYNDKMTGDATDGDGYTFTATGGGNKAQYIVNPAATGSSDIVLKLYDPGTTKGDTFTTQAVRAFDPVSADRVSVSIDYYLTPNAATSTKVMTLKSSSGGTILEYSAPQETNTWKNITAVLDFTSQKYDLYIDGEIAQNGDTWLFNVPFTSSATNLASYSAITVGQNSGNNDNHERSIVLDNLIVKEVGLIEDIDAPEDLAVNTSLTTKTSVDLTWSKVTGATGYIVYYGTDENKMTSRMVIDDGEATGATISGLAPSTLYFFTIAAKRNHTESDKADMVSEQTDFAPVLKVKTPPARTVYYVGDPAIDSTGIAVVYTVGEDETPLPISSLTFEGFDSTAAVASQTITVKYTHPDEGEIAATFTIVIKTPLTPVVIPTTQEMTRTALTGYQNGNKEFTVQNIVYNLKSNPAEDGTGITIKDGVDTITFRVAETCALAATYTTNYGLKLTTQDGYILYNSQMSKEVKTGNAGTYTLTLEPGTYVLTGGTSNTKLSKLVFAAAGSEEIPVPTGLAENGKTDSSVTLKWDAASGATGYVIYYGTSEHYMTSTKQISGGSITTNTIDSLDYGTTYYFAIAAIKDGIGAKSATVSTTTATPVVAVPTGLAVTGKTTTSVSLSWSKVTSATGYTVYYGTSQESMTNTKQISSGDTTVYTVENLSPSTKYYFTVAARMDALISDEAAPPVSETTDAPSVGPGDTPPAVPTGLDVLYTTATTISLIWDSVSGATGYTVYYGTDVSGMTEVKNVSTTQCTIDSLESETTYYLTVAATNATYASEKAAHVSAATKAASGEPEAPVIQTGPSRLTVPAGSDSFKSIIKLKRQTTGGEDEVAYIGVIRE